FEKLKDGKFLIAGLGAPTPSTVGWYNGFLVKFCEDGEVEWKKTFGPTIIFYDIDELSDGNIVAIGGITIITPQLQDRRGLILKIAPNGDVIWYKTFREDTDEIRSNFLYGVKAKKEGGFIVMGKNVKDYLGYDKEVRAYFIEFDNDGNVLVKKYMGEDYVEYFSENLTIRDALILDDGDIVFSWNGYHPYSYALYCFSKNGEYRWGKKASPVFNGGQLFNLAKIDEERNLVFAYYYDGVGAIEFNDDGEIKKENRSFTSSFKVLWPVVTRKLGKLLGGSSAALSCSVDAGTYPDDREYDIGLFKVDLEKDVNEKCAWSTIRSIDWSDADRMETSEIDNFVFLPVDFISEDIPEDIFIESEAKGINTFCPVIYQVNKLQNPFRLEIIGDNLTPLFFGSYDTFYPEVTINDIPVPKTIWKTRQRLIAKKNDALKNMLPKGTPVCIKVRVRDDLGNLYRNFQSDCFYFSR
ncbi:MAG: hypothetical protein ACPLYF_04295, partial [Fervidobacterium sp.]